MSIGFPLVVLVAIVAAVFFFRYRATAKRARMLQLSGFALMAVFSLFIALFVAGETFTDPGGWLAVGLVAAWAIPLALLAALAWLLPGPAIRLFTVLIAGMIGVSIWFAASPEDWRSFEDRNGPIRTIIVFALSAAIAPLGLKRPKAAGVMLLVLGIVPFVVSNLRTGVGSTALLVASSPAVVAGVLYLASAALAGRTAPPGIADTGPKQQPEAA